MVLLKNPKGEQVTVSTQSEYDVNAEIVKAVESNVQETINALSNKYFRAIDVEINVVIK